MLNDISTLKGNRLALPPIPATLTKLRAMLQNFDDCTLEDLTRLVESDLWLATQILTLANSVLYGTKNPVSSLKDAVRRIGFMNIERIATAALLEASLVQPANSQGSELVEQAKLLATNCARIVQHFPNTDLPLDCASAYTFGLFAELGFILESLANQEQLPPDALNHTQLESPECPSFHCHVGYLLARQWGLPLCWALAFKHHHVSLELVDARWGSEICHLVGLLQIAKLISFGVPADA